MSGPRRSPALGAIERLAKMAAGGSSAARMVMAVEDVLTQWGAEEVDASELRERVEMLQTEIDAGLQAAQDFAGEAETEGQRKTALGQVVALTAVQERLAAVVEGRR